MEEIDELRAKAIASMPFSTNPNSSSTAVAISGGGGEFKSLKSREEGEVSSGEDAELPTCSVAPTNSANFAVSVPCTLKNNAINTVKNALTARSSTLDMRLPPSAMRNYQKHYHKHFKRKLPVRSLSSQAFHWHAKESNNNLVISFSDDDSGSESEERYPEKVVKGMDSTLIARDSRIAVTSLPKPIDGIERESDGSKPLPKKGFANHETISSADSGYETSFGAQGPSVENGSLLNRQNSAIVTSACQELGRHAQDSTLTDQRLELLRLEVAARENRLKVQNISVLQEGAAVGSDANQHGLHVMKPEAQATGIRRHAYDANLEFEVDESSKKRLKHDKSSSACDFDVASMPENYRAFQVDNSCTHHQPDSNNTIKSSVIKSKDSVLTLSAANLHDTAVSENDDVAQNGRSEKFSKKAGVSNLPSNYASSMHYIEGNQQMIPTTDVLMPLKTLSIHKSSGLGGSVNNEANTTEEGNMSFHSLLRLEELLDKELEEAQEYRCKCELEERHSLKAYRKAQRSLVEANERCTFLYRKRELFSAKYRAFVIEASKSIYPSDWLCQQNPNEDQSHEPDASTSVHKENGSLDGAVLPIHKTTMSTDVDGEDFPSSNRVVESRSALVDVQIEKAPSIDSSQDYERLEASLRSELVARLGLRASAKMNDTSKRGLDVEKRAGSVAEDLESSQDMERSPLLHDMMPIPEEKETAKLDGIERTQERSHLLGAPLDFNSIANAASNEELYSIADLGTSNSFSKNSGSPINTAVFSLPTSDLHSVCRHAYKIFPRCHIDTFNMKENDNIVTSKEIGVTDFIPDNIGEFLNFKRPAPMGYWGIFESSINIDPFWPLCMFEFRGKCNDEECPWQHMKAGMFPNFQDDEHLNCHATCLRNGKLNATRFPCSALLHVLPIPTYQIGPYLIKADSHQSQSLLARGNWQYQQRGFCASFSIPFSVQRILPLDAPCLQPGDDPVADNYNWNRLSLYYRSQDDTVSFKEQIKQGSADGEQLLEMALNQYDGDLCEPDRRKALSLLSHAIESDPSSVVLWVVFLHIYYKKEKAIGKDDMFLHAVRYNKGSYELWLLYIDSRILFEDRLNAYDGALNVLCRIGGRDERKHLSPYILDIFLQMIDFLSMSGNVDKVIIRIYGLLPSNEFDDRSGSPLRDICSCLTVPDRCLFWTSCIYFIVYEKLPQATVQQFEFVKSLPFGLDWPSAQLTSDRKTVALEVMKLATTEMASYLDDNPNEIDQASFQSMHFLAVSHVKCGAALLSFPAYTELLDKYLKLYPSCMELVLMAVRSRQNCVTDSEFLAFEEALYHWPKETPGIQCLWNQYLEYALTNDRIDLAEKVMARWYQDFPKFRDFSSFCALKTENSFDSSSHINSTGAVQSKTKDDAFGFLNLFLYCILQKSAVDARCAIDKSLELAAPEDYNHFVMEHALFMAPNHIESQKHFPVRSLSSLINHYLADFRASFHLEPLSRRFIRTIKNPRIQQMVNNILGPVAITSTLVNSVLKICYGPSLLPENFGDIKEAFSFVEFLMEITPTNYELALSVYRICSRNLNSVKFWACTLLINSIFQSAPAAPELIWVEAADVLKNSESLEINLRFHKQAISVYPFSVKLWQSYANLYSTTAENGEIIEAAQERGIDLNSILR
ncbi:hypothetical protein M5K25_013201 [Dendrobium thyrsiflorum]|uniref:Putative zinc-finger domain-containing protein n=1 Tax=Dendrobium thyrsiflorum TaxID=117978 RepID=A0ABD0V0B2_DENTH